MLMRLSYQSQKGFSLLEILIVMAVSLILLSGTLSLYTNTIQSSSDALRASKLNQELSAAMSIITADIRRSGYWGTAESNNISNPFTVTTLPSTNISILSGKSCVLYTYDRNSDGSPSNEFYGFKHVDSNADAIKDSIQMRSNGTTTSDCDNGTWDALTNLNSIVIDSLTFDSIGSKCVNSSSTSTPQDNWFINASSSNNVCSDATASGYVAPISGDTLVESRQITINLTGHLRIDPLVSKSMTETIKIRNHRIYVN